METTQNKNKFFYGWVIVIAGTLIMGGVMGIIYNCFSQFIKPICDDLGFTRQAMSMNQTLVSFTQAMVALMWGKILVRFHRRLKQLMLFWAIAGPVAYFCFSLSSRIWMFYIISVIISISMNMLTTLPLAFILSNWFEEKRGLATGVCFMGSGIGGMILNPLLGNWLEQYGWRASFRILAIVMAVIAIPCVLLLRIRPEDMGLKALGHKDIPGESAAGETVLEGYTLAQVKRMPRFWLMLLCGVMMTMCNSSLVQTLSPHLTDCGYTTTFAASMVSLGMGSLALGKVLLGQMFDKLGTKTTALFAVCAGMCGMVGMINCKTSPLFLGLVFFGIAFACSYGNVGNPIIVQNLFGRREFSAILGLYTASTSMGGSISPIINGASVDHLGSYRPAFFLWAAQLIFVFICYLLILPSGKKEKE